MKFIKLGLFVASLLILTGCAAPTAPPVAELGQLQFNKLDPCQLLTTEQQHALGASQVRPANYEPGGSNCAWASDNSEAGDGWAANLEYGQPFPTTLGTTVPTRSFQLAGFSVLEGANPSFKPNTSCFQTIRIAPNQTLVASYDVVLANAAVDHQKICEINTQFSKMLIDNLRALAGR